MTYEAILFDMDGVLWRHHPNTPAVHRPAIRRALAAFDVETAAVSDDEMDALLNADDLSAQRTVCASHDIDDFAAFWTRRERELAACKREMLLSGDRTAFDDVDVLASLADRYSLAVVSNNHQETVDAVLDHYNFGDHVSTAFGREPTVAGAEKRKPETDYVEAALADLGRSPDECLYVGDRPTDVLAADALGMDAAYLSRAHHDRPEPTVTPMFAVADLTELRAHL